MNQKSVFASMLIAVLLMIGAASTASAYYDPEQGRFISRDPINTVNQPNAPNVAYPRVGQITPAVYSGPVRVGGGIAALQSQGRTIKRDPIEKTPYADGMNLYQYVQGNPLAYIDPMGLLSVDVCVRPLAVFPDGLPWWASPANHAYIQIGSWSAGFQSDDSVHIPEDDTQHSGKKCWPAKKVKKGTLPDGTPCKCATDDQIEGCIKSYAQSGAYPDYHGITNNCGDWVINALKRCCLKGKVPWHTYGPNHGDQTQ